MLVNLNELTEKIEKDKIKIRKLLAKNLEEILSITIEDVILLNELGIVFFSRRWKGY